MGGKTRAWYTLSVHVPKCPGILGHRDTIRTFLSFLMGVASALHVHVQCNDSEASFSSVIASLLSFLRVFQGSAIMAISKDSLFAYTSGGSSALLIVSLLMEGQVQLLRGLNWHSTHT